MTKQEGVTKYQLEFTPAPPLSPSDIVEIEAWRSTLHQYGLIGQDHSRYGGFGYGNISRRLPPYDMSPGRRKFVISGTQTGHLSILGPEHYTVVTAYRPEQNKLVGQGPIRPSSESLTHGAVYDQDSAIRVVMHAHSPAIWQCASALALPVTAPDVAYGTPEMAAEVAHLFCATNVLNFHLFVMGGHEDGVISFGATAGEAGEVLLAALRKAQSLASDL